MENLIMVHGIAVQVVGNDFGGEEADFNKVCDKIEAIAAELDKAAIEAAIWDIEANDYVGRGDQRLQRLADSTCMETLRGLGWDNPNVPSVTVFGIA